MSASTDHMPSVELNAAWNSDCGDSVPQTVGEQETPIDKQETEIVSTNQLRLRHVENETISVFWLDLQTNVSVVSDCSHQVQRHPAVLTREPGIRYPHILLAELSLSAERTNTTVAPIMISGCMTLDAGASLLTLVTSS